MYRDCVNVEYFVHRRKLMSNLFHKDIANRNRRRTRDMIK